MLTFSPLGLAFPVGDDLQICVCGLDLRVDQTPASSPYLPEALFVQDQLPTNTGMLVLPLILIQAEA